MKRLLSLIACCIVCAVMVQYRTLNSDLSKGQPPLKVTLWDAFGYYVYLPSTIIYHDCTQLKWLDTIDKKYAVTGGDGYQAQRADNGNYVFKYLGGVALLELPLFLAGHFVALHSHWPADGFSAPYQYALGYGIVLYCFLALLLLRRILLRYFSEATTVLTLLAVGLGTNFLQYAAVDNGQSHAYIFPLYVVIMWATMRWHDKPSAGWAGMCGYIIGLAAISRPTEAVMLFIPLMWNTHTREYAAQKWQQWRDHKKHLMLAALGGFAGILPQLIYWKYATGSFVYDVGSKWDFLNPHFRVLVGWEKGWFIYTPITVLFIAGMFFIRQFPFRKSVLWFCLLNIYIIIAWHDWRYGGSYSTRALVQSYPMFALPFAAVTEAVFATRWRRAFYAVCIYLIGVNLFQTWQYDKTILHYNDMNMRYYGHIYLNPHPSAAGMSLLDNEDYVRSEKGYEKTIVVQTTQARTSHFDAGSSDILAEQAVHFSPAQAHERWIKLESSIHAPGCLWQTYLNVKLAAGGKEKVARARLFNAISTDSSYNQYVCYMRIPDQLEQGILTVYLNSPFTFNGQVASMKVTALYK